MKNVNFRNTFLKDFNSLFSKGYLDWKIDNDFFKNIRYSNYMDEEHIISHINKLRKYYKVSLKYGTFNQSTNNLYFEFNPNQEVIRIFPIENNFSKENINTGILSINDNNLYTRETIKKEIYSEFMTNELLSNNKESTLDDIVEIVEDGIQYRY